LFEDPRRNSLSNYWVLQAQRARSAAGEENALDLTTLNVAAHRLQSLIHDRRILLAAPPGSKFQV
jgi:hypothetical protein